MRKIAILFLLLFGSASSQTKLNRYDAKPTLALFTFEGTGMQDEDIALYTGYLIVELHKTKSFILVEKNQINELLREKKYDRMDCKTMDCAIEIGKLIGITPAITTAGDLRFGIALDEPPEGFVLTNPEDVKYFTAEMLSGECVS